MPLQGKEGIQRNSTNFWCGHWGFYIVFPNSKVNWKSVTETLLPLRSSCHRYTPAFFKGVEQCLGLIPPHPTPPPKVTTKTQSGSKTPTSFLLLTSCESLGKVLDVPVSSSRKQVMRVEWVNTVSSSKLAPKLNGEKGSNLPFNRQYPLSVEQHSVSTHRPAVFIPSTICPRAPNFAFAPNTNFDDIVERVSPHLLFQPILSIDYCLGTGYKGANVCWFPFSSVTLAKFP